MMNTPDAISSEERLWAMLAHLSGLLGWVTTIGQFLVPLIIYLVYRERSRFVAYHALQQLLFQIFLLVALVVLTIVGVVIGVITCGIGFVLVIPLFLALIIYVLVYIIWAAIEAYNGKWFRIPLVGDWTSSLVQP
ncbi:MAG: DUF4870 domain-containing protein [Armatimonadetes bacterium]|jgi:uncharacterized Tic20 family protein|nr:DUF4870 domain-containing protein [Armatimonadota bacterium]CUU34721.1 hypothetical protein DCOP10_11024 [Armatimonadetes bacterium DC]